MATPPTPQADPAGAPSTSPAKSRSRSETARLLAVAILAVAATLFAVVNFDEVKVDLLVDSARLPLIVVIVACLAIGGIFGAVLSRRGARARRRKR